MGIMVSLVEWKQNLLGEEQKSNQLIVLRLG